MFVATLETRFRQELKQKPGGVVLQCGFANFPEAGGGTTESGHMDFRYFGWPVISWLTYEK